MQKLTYGWRVLQAAVQNFLDDKCFRYAAALSFYALFSIAPMVLISVHVAGIIAYNVDFQQEITQQFTQLLGSQGAEGITVLLDNLEEENSSTFQLIVGALVLVFSATNIFVQLQDAFNEIFSVKAAEGKGLIKKLLDRLISLGVILSLGFILIISLVIDSAIVLMQDYLTAVFPGIAVAVIGSLQYLILAGLAMLEIYALLHYLPDVTIKKSYKIKGTILIAVLMLAGKTTISWYIGNSRFSELGGATASVIVLMLWIYYSSLIVFFGAEVIKAMGQVDDIVFFPRRYAVRVETVIVSEDETGKKTVEKKATDTLPSDSEIAS